jgi:hypothetical protein
VGMLRSKSAVSSRLSVGSEEGNPVGSPEGTAVGVVGTDVGCPLGAVGD